MDNQWLGQDSRVETEVKAMVRTIEAGVLDFPPLSGHWVEMSGENDDEAVDFGFSVGYPAWDEAKFAVSDVVSDFTDDKLGTCIGPQILWPISVWLWDVGDCHLSSWTVKDLSCHVTEIQETLCWKIPPKCFISIVSPNLFFGILVGANHFHWSRPTGDRSPTCYWGHSQPIVAVDGHHDWVFTSFGVWTLAKACPIQDCTGESLHDAMKTWWGHLVTPRCTKKYMFSLILDAKTVHSRSTTWLRSRTWHFFWQNKGIYRVG